MKMYGKDRGKGNFQGFWGLNTKIKFKIYSFFMSLNREVISFSFSVGLLVFMYL